MDTQYQGHLYTSLLCWSVCQEVSPFNYGGEERHHGLFGFAIHLCHSQPERSTCWDVYSKISIGAYNLKFLPVNREMVFQQFSALVEDHDLAFLGVNGQVFVFGKQAKVV